MVDALHAAGLEVVLDVVFNHTAEGDQPGPTLCFRGLDNPAYYRLDPADPSRYVDTTGCGNSLNAGDTRDPAADHGLAAVLADRDARRRLPLRPRARRWPARRAASTRCRRSSTSSRRIRWCRRPSSSPSRGTSARWTATTSAASRRCGGSGTASTATAMRDFWRSHRSGSASSPPASAARRTSTAARERRRPTASVNLITVHDGFTLRRPGLLRRQAQRGQRRGQPGRHRRQPLLELRRRGADRRPGHPGAARAAVPGDAHHPAAVVRRADAARRGRARPHPAGQQQRLLPGQRDHLVRLVQRGRGAAGLHPAADRVPQAAPGVPPPALPRRDGGGRARLVHPGGHADDRRPTGPTPAPGRSPSTSTGPTTPTGRGRHPAGRRRLPRPGQRLVGTARLRHPGDPRRAGVAGGDRHLRSRRARRGAARHAGDRVTAGPRSVVVLRGPRPCRAPGPPSRWSEPSPARPPAS